MEPEEVYSQPSRTKRARTKKPKRFMRHVLRRGPSGPHSVHGFTRKAVQTLAVTNETTLVNYANMFALNQLPNYAEFTALFDMFRIKKIEITWIYDHNSGDVSTAAGVAANANMGLPNLYVVTDYDDATVLSAAADYLQYEPCKITRMDKQVRWTIYPHLAVSAYNGAWTGYKNEKSGWLDASSANIQHYGCKWAIDASMCNITAGASVRIGTLNVYYKYFVDFKLTR